MKKWRTKKLISCVFFAPAMIFLCLMLTASELGVRDASAIMQASASASSWVSVTLGQSISIKLEANRMDFDVIPNKTGVFDYHTTGVSVSTNNESGYFLTVGSITDETGLTGTRGRVDTLPNAVNVTNESQENFNVNTWGLTTQSNLGAGMSGITQFSPIQTKESAAKIRTSDQAVTDEMTYVTIGMKVNSDLPGGEYSNTLIFTAITNAVEPMPNLPEFYSIATLQEMTPEICAATTTPKSTATKSDPLGLRYMDDNYVPESEVTDVRDGNTYTIRKLADGNCWTIDNMRLASPDKETILTPADSDVAKNTTLPKAQIESGEIWSTDDWEPTEAEVNTPHIFFGGDPKHGALYNWNAATAKTGTFSVNGSGQLATGSICPKGWKLPTSTIYEDLTVTYNIDAWSAAGYETLQSKPLEFSLGGYYSAALGAQEYSGLYGQYWGSDAGDQHGAGALYIYDSYAFTYWGASKADGLSVRCIAK